MSSLRSVFYVVSEALLILVSEKLSMNITHLLCLHKKLALNSDVVMYIVLF